VFPHSLGTEPGSHTAAYFAARGIPLTVGEAVALVRAFVRLADLGAISTVPGDECRDSPPKTPAPAGVSCAGRGAVGGHRRKSGPELRGANAYNIAPSDGISGSEQ